MVGESDKAELKKEREEREAFEDEATMKIKKLEHDNETLEAEIDAAKQEERDFKPYWSSFFYYMSISAINWYVTYGMLRTVSWNHGKA